MYRVHHFCKSTLYQMTRLHKFLDISQLKNIRFFTFHSVKCSVKWHILPVNSQKIISDRKSLLL